MALYAPIWYIVSDDLSARPEVYGHSSSLRLRVDMNPERGLLVTNTLIYFCDELYFSDDEPPVMQVEIAR